MTNDIVVLLILSAVLAKGDLLPATLPPWPSTYDMSKSTLTMQCNGSGWSSPSRGASFGIVSYDWSNAKKQWAAHQPMDSEARLLEQAVMTKKADTTNNTRVFVYRNVVKAHVNLCDTFGL